MLALLALLLAPPVDAGQAKGPPSDLLDAVPPAVALAAYVEPGRFLKAAGDAGLPADDLAKLVKAQFAVEPGDIKDTLLLVDPFPGGNVAFFPAALYRGTAKAPTLETLLGGAGVVKAKAEGREFFESAAFKMAGTPIAGAKLAGGVTAVAPLPTLKTIVVPAGKAARPLTDRFKRVGVDHDFTAVMAMRPVRDKLPKPDGLTEAEAALYDAIDTATLTVDFHEPVMLKVELAAQNVEDAVRLMDSLSVFRKEAAIGAARGGVDRLIDQAPEALRKPLKALADEAINRATLERKGTSVVLTVNRPKDFGPLRKPAK